MCFFFIAFTGKYEDLFLDSGQVSAGQLVVTILGRQLVRSQKTTSHSVPFLALDIQLAMLVSVDTWDFFPSTRLDCVAFHQFPTSINQSISFTTKWVLITLACMKTPFCNLSYRGSSKPLSNFMSLIRNNSE